MNPPSHHPHLKAALVGGIAVLSGIAGVGYEMVWTRQLGLSLGTEVAAVVGSVVALFAGLAAGGILLDPWIRKHPQPARAYAGLEVVIGLWGLLSVATLPALARWLPALVGPFQPPLVMWAVAVVVPVLVLAPATIAMGGTLALLERILDRTLGRPRLVAYAYAANTAGALLGVLATVGLLFAAVGLGNTLIVLSLCNFLAAAAAWALDRAQASGAHAASDEHRASGIAEIFPLALTGFLGIGIEIALIRIGAQFLSDTIYTFAGLLVAYLAGTALGSAARQWIPLPAGVGPRAWLAAIASIATLLTLAMIPMIAQVAILKQVVDPLREGFVAAALFLPCSIAMGAQFADLLARYVDRHGSAARASGFNALGAMVAPPVMVLILIPWCGAMDALLILGVGYLAVLPLHRRSWLPLVATVVVAAALVHLHPALPDAYAVNSRILQRIEGPLVAASVVEDRAGARYLEVNGHLRMGGTGSERSDFRQGLLPLLLHGTPHNALYLGVGTGATLSAALQFPSLSVRGVEISPEVVSLIPAFVTPPRRDPSAAVLLSDARRYLAAGGPQYDVIVADNFHPALEGSGSLYSREHFLNVRSRLAARGVFCQWLPLYQLSTTSLRDIVRTYQSVFPSASGWLAHFSVRMPMLALCARADDAPLEPSPNKALPTDAHLVALLAQLGWSDGMALSGAWIADARALKRYAGAGQLNTDDHPLVALNAWRNVEAMNDSPERILLSLIDLMNSARWGEASQRPDVVRMQAYLRARNLFMQEGLSLSPGLTGRALIEAAAPGLLRVIAISPEFEPAYQPLLSMAVFLTSSDPLLARQILQQLSLLAPQRPEARALLEQLR